MDKPQIFADEDRYLFTVNELVKLAEFACFTSSSMRHLIFNSKSRQSSQGHVLKGNGLVESGALVRIGRRVLIDIRYFRTWIDSKRDSDCAISAGGGQ